MPIKPLHDYVLVQVETQHVSEAGIIFAAAHGIKSSQAQYGHRARVLAVGPGKKDKKGRIQPIQVQPGDVVRFGEFDFPKFENDQVMIREADITGIEVSTS